MSPGEYTEDQLVEQPVIQLFGQLGWRTASAAEEVFGLDGTLGRDGPREAVLLPRLLDLIDDFTIFSERTQVRLAIEDAPDEGLPPPYASKLYENKVAAVFEHVYETYQQGG